MVYVDFEDDFIVRLGKSGAPSEEKIIKKLQTRSSSRPLLKISTNPNLHVSRFRKIRIVVSRQTCADDQFKN